MQSGGRTDPPESLEEEGRAIVERLGGEWRRGGGLCRCPSHDDRSPSLSVRPGARRLLFHCFAGCEPGEIIRSLPALNLLGPARAAQTMVTAPSPADPGRLNRGVAVRLWEASRPIGRSPAEAYLRSRGLEASSAELRYHPRTPYGRGAQALFRPALVAAVRDGAGLMGIHRTFLDLAPVRLASLPVPKRALGRLGGGAVRLGRPCDGQLGFAEGIENALSATALTGIPCWATLGTERFARVALSPGLERLILFLDNDAGGRRAERLAREAHAGALEIEARYPATAGADWNDVLLARARG